MRLHVINLPHTQVTEAYSTCAYTQKVRKFANMMTDRGHEVLLYASEESHARVAVHIPVISKSMQQHFGFNGPEDYLKIDFTPESELWQTFNTFVIAELRNYIQPGDIICVITGRPTQAIKDAFPNNLFVEFGIGYEGIIPDSYHVFESYAWQNYVSGRMAFGDGRFYDEVIPNYFEKDDFPFWEEPSDFYLYIGRLTDRKGWRIAQDVCERLGKRLIVAGPGEFSGYGDYVGTVGAYERGILMSRAKAVFVPTLYNPPFEGVHIEANLCGTPVITTDFGVFSETVENGFNGYRCKDLQQFVDVVRSMEAKPFSIEERFAIRVDAQEKYSTEVVAERYEKYFNRLLKLYGEGWTQVL